MAPTPLHRPFSQSKYTWLLAFLAGLSLAFTGVYALALTSTTGTLDGWITSLISPSNAVAVLRVLSEATSVLFTALIASTLDAIMWTTACTERGVAMSTLLSTSTTTGVLGLFELLKWKAVGRHYLVIAMR
jgi:hypothetical protein